MLFHRLEAWNLAYAMYDDPKMSFTKFPYIEHTFEEGFRNGWIRPERWRAALEMYVLDNAPLVNLDIDPRMRSYGINWPSNLPPGIMGRYRVSELRALKGLILYNLQYAGTPMTERAFDDLLTTWERWPEKTRWAHTSRPAHAVELEFGMISLSLELARRGIATYSRVPTAIGEVSAKPPDNPEDDLTVAKFYFANQVRVPSPQTFSQAANLRDNARIQNWRAKVQAWSQQLTAGTIKPEDIKGEIKEANGYIEGVEFPHRLVPKWSSVVTLPASFYHVFILEGPWAHAIGIGLFAYEALHFFGQLASSAVKNSDPLKHKWFLVSNEA
jgi:hypothetical protein